MDNKVHIFVPGRLCIFGEHSDWAGAFKNVNPSIVEGKCIVIGLQQGIYSRCEPNHGKLFFSTILGEKEIISKTIKFDEDSLLEIVNGEGFFSYIAGTALQIYRKYATDGANIDIYKMTLPIGKGLSSSAAICVTIARCFNELYKLNLCRDEIMQLAYLGEKAANSQCGIMDQMCEYGVGTRLLTIRGSESNITEISLGGTFFFVIICLDSQKNTRAILSTLQKAYPYPQILEHEGIQSTLGKENIYIVNEAYNALCAGDAKQLGELMDNAQMLFDEKIASLFPHVFSSIAQEILEDKYIKNITYGGKETGSHGGGNVLFLAKDETCQRKIIEYLSAKSYSSYPLTI